MKRLFAFILVCMFVMAGCAPKTEAAPLMTTANETEDMPVATAQNEPAAVTMTSSSEQAISPTWSFPGTADWKLTGQSGGITKALFQDGDWLYLGVGLHVIILDVSDAHRIEVIGTSPLLPDFIENIAGDEAGHLFVSCGSSGLVILNVANPSAPFITGYFDTMGYTESATVYGHFLILADGPNGVLIADISDIQSPVIVSQAYPLAYIYDVAIANDVAYAAAGTSGVLTIDLRDPIQPKEMGLISLDGCQYDVIIIDGGLYLASAWGGISVLDISEPLAPKLSSNTKTDGWAFALAEIGQTLLVMDGANGVDLYNVIGERIELVSTLSLGGFIMAGVAEDKTAFVLDKEKGLVAIDYTNQSKRSRFGDGCRSSTGAELR